MLPHTAVLFSLQSALFIHDELTELSMTDAPGDYAVSFLRLSNEELTNSGNPTSQLMQALKDSMLCFVSSTSSQSDNSSSSSTNIRIGAAVKELEIQ